MATYAKGDRLVYQTEQSGKVLGIAVKINADHLIFRVTSRNNHVYAYGVEFPVWPGPYLKKRG